MPVLPSWLTEPLWEQFAALLPERPVYDPAHPLGCHRRRISDRVVFDKLLQLLRFGCSYQAIADPTCSATMIRTRRDEWIRLGVFARLRQLALQAYDRIVGLALDQVAVDGCITKAPGGGEVAGRSPVDRGKQGLKRSGMVDGYGILLGRVLAGANRHDSPLLAPTLDLLNGLGPLPEQIAVHLDAGYDSDNTRTLWPGAACTAASLTRAKKPLSRRVGGGMWSGHMPGRTPSIAWPAALSAAPCSPTRSSTSSTPSSPSAV
ncbi:hypothetical protein EES42_42820 [Streptomyces sp. ADI95-17]|nr:hypothetical protein EES42_42820 [Streptomyces sp. ADI95-17]